MKQSSHQFCVYAVEQYLYSRLLHLHQSSSKASNIQLYAILVRNIAQSRRKMDWKYRA